MFSVKRGDVYRFVDFVPSLIRFCSSDASVIYSHYMKHHLHSPEQQQHEQGSFFLFLLHSGNLSCLYLEVSFDAVFKYEKHTMLIESVLKVCVVGPFSFLRPVLCRMSRDENIHSQREALTVETEDHERPVMLDFDAD